MARPVYVYIQHLGSLIIPIVEYDSLFTFPFLSSSLHPANHPPFQRYIWFWSFHHMIALEGSSCADVPLPRRRPTKPPAQQRRNGTTNQHELRNVRESSLFRPIDSERKTEPAI